MDVLKEELLEKIASSDLEVIGGEEGEIKRLKEEGNVVGEIEKYVRIEVEVAKGSGKLSRVQFAIKVPNGKLKFNLEEVESGQKEYIVRFSNLQISYIDTKGNVYFKADDYEVKEEIKND